MEWLKTKILYFHRIPDFKSLTYLCRRTDEYQTLISNIQNNPLVSEYTMRLQNHVEPNHVLINCLHSDGMQIAEREFTQCQARDDVTGNSHSVACTKLTISWYEKK
jgi:hypothetical protein